MKKKLPSSAVVVYVVTLQCESTLLAALGI